MTKKKKNVASVIPRTTARPPPSLGARNARPDGDVGRVKFLLLLGSGCPVSRSCGRPRSTRLAARSPTRCIALNDYSWILILAGIEFVRQLHYYLEEHSKGYFRFWEKKVFGSAQGLGRGIRRLDPVPPRSARKFFIVLLARAPSGPAVQH